MKMKAVIVENDEQTRVLLATRFSFYNIFDFVEMFDNPDKAYEYILNNQVDVIFINLEAGNSQFSSDGTYLALNLSDAAPDVITITYSMQDHPGSEIARLNCADFFVLPAAPATIQQVTNRIKYRFDLLQYKRSSQSRSMMVKTNQGYQLVNLDNVLFIERYNRKNRMLTIDGQQIMLNGYTLDELSQLLSPAGFYRCYQSFIVNLSKVNSIRADSVSKNYALQFEGFVGEILLSRDKYGEIIKLLKDRYAKISL